MRAVVNPLEGTVYETKIGDYKDYYKHLGAESFDVVRGTIKGHDISIFVDDDGLKYKLGNLVRLVLLDDDFKVELAGNLVFTGGVDIEGETLPLHEDITSKDIYYLVSSPIGVIK